jgi:DNA mismatch endonuclease (patch repair protein)
MSRIRGKDTKPEIAVRSLLHKLGYRFRLKSCSLPGRPDIVLPKYHAVVFVHGCFWHRHSGCRFAYAPKSRVEFWNTKFECNVARDRLVYVELDTLNWHHLTVWECELRDKASLTLKIEEFFCGI